MVLQQRSPSPETSDSEMCFGSTDEVSDTSSSPPGPGIAGVRARHQDLSATSADMVPRAAMDTMRRECEDRLNALLRTTVAALEVLPDSPASMRDRNGQFVLLNIVRELRQILEQMAYGAA